MPDEKDVANDYQLGRHNVEKIAHRVTPRISDDALYRIMLEEEKRIQEKVRLASTVAERAGRKTVREDDLRIVDQILGADVSNEL